MEGSLCCVIRLNWSGKTFLLYCPKFKQFRQNACT